MAGGALAAAVIAVGGYFAWRVADARARTPAIIARAVAAADPDIRDLPPERVAQYLAVEDPTFWTNDGIDLTSPGAGLTTTTQGLGKLIYFRRFHPGPWDKPQLMLMARYALTPGATKRDIFTAALSLAWMGEAGGRPVIGFGEAARTYFGRPLHALSEDQFLALVATQLGPATYSPLKHPQANAERVRRIKRLLASACRPTGWDDVVLEGCRLRD